VYSLGLPGKERGLDQGRHHAADDALLFLPDVPPLADISKQRGRILLRTCSTQASRSEHLDAEDQRENDIDMRHVM